MIFDRVLKKLVKSGNLTVTDWKNRITKYGDGSGKPVHIKFATAATARKIASRLSAMVFHPGSSINIYVGVQIELGHDGRLIVDVRH